MNPLFDEIQGARQNSIIQQFNAFMRNPMQYLIQRRVSIPQEYMRDPKGAVEYLMQNGMMSNEQFNTIVQMANRMGIRLS